MTKKINAPCYLICTLTKNKLHFLTPEGFKLEDNYGQVQGTVHYLITYTTYI